MYQQRGQLDAPSTTGINVICTSPHRYPMRAIAVEDNVEVGAVYYLIHNTMIVLEYQLRRASAAPRGYRRIKVGTRACCGAWTFSFVPAPSINTFSSTEDCLVLQTLRYSPRPTFSLRLRRVAA